MRVMKSREFRRKIGEVIRGREGVVVTVRGKPSLLAIPLDTEEGKKILSILTKSAYEKFISRGRSGERDASERHDEIIYDEE